MRLRQFPAIVKSLLFIAARLAQHFIDLRLVNRAGDAVAQNRNFIRVADPRRTLPTKYPVAKEPAGVALKDK
ncbi:hypothetical protein K4G91_21325, partial [Mycobacterium tuberculosis]|nr:hypothetical protein [Mycobacterium tuberculosis]